MHSNADDLPPPSLTIPVPSWLVVTATVLLAVVLNFDQLFLRLASHLPGQTLVDSADALWHLWWANFGFAQSDGLAINAWVGAPYLINHLTNLPVLPGLPFGLLERLLGPLAAFNLILILAQLVTHLALILFFRSRSQSVILALLAATAFMLSPWYADALARVDLIVLGLWSLPLALWAWDRWLDSPGFGRAGLLIIMLVAAFWSGVAQLSWVFALFIPYALWTAFSQRLNLTADQTVRDQLLGMIFIVLIFLLIFPMPAVVRSLLGNEPPFGLSNPQSPNPLTSLIGPILDSGPLIWLLGLATLAFIQNVRQHAFWLVCAPLFLLIGVYIIPEPLRMLAGAFALPFQSLYSADVFLGLALFPLLTFTVTHWAQAAANRPGWQVYVTAGLILILAVLSSPATFQALPLQSINPSPALDEIAADPEDYLLLVYPFGLNSRFDDRSLGEGADLAVYAPWHHKRMLNGSAPMIDSLVFDRFSEMSFLTPSAESPDPAAVDDLTEAINNWRIGYVLIYPDRLGSEEVERIDSLLQETNALCPPERTDMLWVYRARWHPEGCS